MSKPGPPDGETNPLGRPTIPRVVRSTIRRHRPRELCAISVDGDGAALMLVPRDFEVLSEPEGIIARLRERIPWTVATDDAGTLFTFLVQYGGEGYRAHGTIHEARQYRAHGKQMRSARVRAAFSDFGWDRQARAIVLDPSAFSDLSLSELFGETTMDRGRLLMRLCMWAADMSRWCERVGVNLRPGRGGIGAQFLTDLRWWPEWRRKVPRRLNAEARAELPGNYYRMMSSNNHHTALELDQKSAHHQIARRVDFTDSDTLHALGTTGDRAAGAKRLLCGRDDPRFAQLIRRPGLFWLRLNVSHRALERRVPLPQATAPGITVVAVWSPEIDDLVADADIEVIGIVGAIVSRDRRPSLNAYARFALAQLREADVTRRRWLKPLLLSSYGVMAQSPKARVSFSTTPTAHSTEERAILGRQIVTVHVARATHATEPRYANLIDRGIIESETRAETIRVARAIERDADADRDAEIVALYADSVLVGAAPRPGARASDGIEHSEWAERMTALAADAGRGEWHASARTDLRMLAPNAYRSVERTKIPGQPRSGREPPDMQAKSV